MIDEKYINIIDKAADGTATSSELDQLKKYFEVNDEAQEYYNKVIGLSLVLNKTQNVPPPHDLKNKIMNSIHHNMYKKECPDKSFRNFIIFIRNIFDRKTAIAFSIGSVFGIILILLLTNLGNIDVGVNDRDAIGSILLKKSVDDSHIIDTRTLNTNKVNGSIEASRINDIVFLNLALVSENDTAVTIIFNENDIECIGFIMHEVSNKDVEMHEGKIIINCGGIANYEFLLNEKVEANPLISVGIQSDREDDSIIINLKTGLE